MDSLYFGLGILGSGGSTPGPFVLSGPHRDRESNGAPENDAAVRPFPLCHVTSAI